MYILFTIFLSLNGGPTTVATAEYTSYSSCMTAKAAIEQAPYQFATYKTLVCTAK